MSVGTPIRYYQNYHENHKVSDRPRYINRVKNIMFEELQIKRAGIIPFTLIDGQPLFYMGIDTVCGELTDFGGSLWKEIKETPLACAIREFDEESLGVFPKIDLENALCIYDVYRLVIFMLVPINDYNELFQQKFIELKDKPEVCGVSEIDLENFSMLAKDNHPQFKLYRILTNLFKTFASVGAWLSILYSNTYDTLLAGKDTNQSLSSVIQEVRSNDQVSDKSLGHSNPSIIIDNL